MHAAILTDPGHFSHLSISIANTRLSVCAYVIEERLGF